MELDFYFLHDAHEHDQQYGNGHVHARYGHHVNVNGDAAGFEWLDAIPKQSKQSQIL